MGIAATDAVKLGQPYWWNAAWYVPVLGEGFELKFRQKDAPSDADVLEVYGRVSAKVEPEVDREVVLAELKNMIVENDIKPLELFAKSVIDKVVK